MLEGMFAILMFAILGGSTVAAIMLYDMIAEWNTDGALEMVGNTEEDLDEIVDAELETLIS